MSCGHALAFRMQESECILRQGLNPSPRSTTKLKIWWGR